PAPTPAPAPPGSAPAPGVAATLGAHHWRLETAVAADGSRIDALFANPDAALQLDFAEGRVSIANACNAMGGEFNLDADILAIGPMAGTKRACATPLMDMEREAQTRLAGRHALTLEDGQAPRLSLANGLGDRLDFVGERRTPAR